MNDNTYNILLPLLQDFAFIVGFSLFLLSFLVGLVLILRPEIIIRLNQQAAKSFSFRRFTRILEVPNNIEPLFYRHHKIIGVVVALISVYVLYYFLLIYDASVISAYLKASDSALVLDLLISTLRLVMLISSAAILLLGIAIFFRPSQLKTFERWANRWISTRQASRPLSVERDQVNQLTYKYPRLVGLSVVFLSLYAGILLFLVYTG